MGRACRTRLRSGPWYQRSHPWPRRAIRFVPGNLLRCFCGVFAGDLFFPLEDDRLGVEVGDLYLSQEDGAPAAIARIPGIHTHVGSFEEFFVVRFGILQEAGHDTDVAGRIPEGSTRL